MRTQEKQYKYPINDCDNCGDDNTVLERFCDIYYVICKRCKNSTIDCISPEEAIKEWNNNNERNNC